MTSDEEMHLRELAAGRCTTPAVVAAIGPLSLWSKDGLAREIEKAVAAEREACAQAARTAMLGSEWALTERVMRAIRARGTRAEPPFIDPRGSLGEPIV